MKLITRRLNCCHTAGIQTHRYKKMLNEHFILICKRGPNGYQSPKDANYRTKYFKFLPGEKSHYGSWVSLMSLLSMRRIHGPEQTLSKSFSMVVFAATLRDEVTFSPG